MKTQYITPQVTVIDIRTKYFLCQSTLTESIYTDNPQDITNALVIEQINIWDDEW